MSTAAAAPAEPGGRPIPKPKHTGRWAAIILTVLALVLVIAGTKVVPDGEEAVAGSEEFDRETFGAEHFPAIQEEIIERAVEAPVLAEAIADDPEQAAEEYGVQESGNILYSTSFTGTVEGGESGIYDVAVEGMPEDVSVRIQTGPAINGTELRDATGTLDFGQFTNQIEFQDAGSALNEEMKVQVLDPIDVDSLEGSTVTVIGAFTAINPQGWLVTPVSLEVQ